MKHQQHALRFLTLCLTTSPDSPNFWEQREGQVEAIYFYLYICIYIIRTYINRYAHTQWEHSAHQYFSGLSCIHWLEDRFGLTWSFHLDSKEEALWTLVLLTQRSAFWNCIRLLEPKMPPGTTPGTFGNLDLPGGSSDWNLSSANIWGIKYLPSLHWILCLGDGLLQIQTGCWLTRDWWERASSHQCAWFYCETVC